MTVFPRRSWARFGAAGLALTITSCATAARVAPGSSGPLTRAERTGYLETSTYPDVIAFLDSLRGRPELAFGSIGKTNEGREIPYVIASRPRVETPEQARSLGRPIIYVQGNINDRFGKQAVNRGSQNGPEMVGVRANAQGLDLNRDYIKAEAPETRASLAMFNRWNPHVFVDLHTTNGSYHGYALTYAASLNPAAPLAPYQRDKLMPVLRERMHVRRGFATFDYGDFISDDTLSRGWITFDSRPRFGTNYYGLRKGFSILSEAYSHDPFEARVKSTYAYVREILSSFAEQGVPGLASAPAFRDGIPIRSRLVARPNPVAVSAEIVERTGDSTRYEAGMPPGRKRTGRLVTVEMPIFDHFEPTLYAPIPERYVLRPSDTAAVRILRYHGIEVRAAPQHSISTERPVEGFVFAVDSAIASPRLFQGHREMRVEGRWRRESRTVPSGSFIVDTGQPLALLAVYLLEPQSDDGLVTWNFFDADLKPGSTYPVFKIGGSPPSP